MKRLIFPLILVAAMACGGESTPVGDAMEGAENDVAAAGDSTTAVEEAGPPATEAMEGSTASDNTIAQRCMDLVADHERIMVSRSLSKSYALAGLRFGFLVAQPHLIEQFVKVKDSYNCDALSISGATAAIDDQKWLAQNRNRVINSRQRLTASMQQLGFSVQPSQANFIWCTHAEQPVQPIYESLKSNHVLVRYMNYPGWDDGLRVSVGTDEQIDAFLSLLQSMMG